MTDFITVSRKEIEALQKNFTKEGLSGNGDYINVSDLRALLDKAEVVRGEPVSQVAIAELEESNSNLKSQWMYYQDLLSLNGFDGIADCIHVNKKLQKQVTELEAEIAKLTAIIEDMKVVDNVFSKSDLPYGICPVCGGAGLSRERRPNGNDKCVNGHVYPSREAMKATNDK